MGYFCGPMMKAVLLKEYGGPEQMYIGECERPELKEGEILVRVEASALNRADTVQRKGRYPPPPGASAILGLECAGVVEEIGPKCDGCRVQVGDRVAGSSQVEGMDSTVRCLTRWPSLSQKPCPLNKQPP